ncbi:MAG: hypothetical protein P8M30_04780 [Planctomycetaceae bacterium]|nr:hypothetical protein [Planctomycetaceae bacterium]
MYHPLTSSRYFFVNRGSILFAMCVILTQVVVTPHNQASADDKTKEVIGILKILIDSQQNKNNRPGRQGPPGRGPQNPPPNQPQHHGDMAQTRKVLANYAQEITKLTTLYAAEISRKPELRASIGECYQLRAQVITLAQASQQTKHTHHLQNQAQQVDTSWRGLSHKLQLVPGLSRNMSQSLTQLAQHNQAMCTLLEIEPQLDWRELMRSADALTYEMKAISEELGYSQRNQNNHKVLLLARKAHQEASHFSESIANKQGYRLIVDEYGNFLKLWNSLAPHLRASGSSHLIRHLNRVISLDSTLHNHLWLEKKLDRETLIHLSKSLQLELNSLFDRITLSFLITIPNNEGIAASADELNGLCSHLADCVARRESREEIIEAFSYLPTSWVSFSRPFRNLQNPEILDILRSIETRIVAIQQTLGHHPDLDWNDARQHAALLENMSGHLAEHIQDWFRGPKKPNQAFQYQLYRAMDDFSRSSKQLNLSMLNQDRAAIKAGCENTASDWAKLHALLKTCESKEREAIEDDSIDVTKALLQLEIMFLL